MGSAASLGGVAVVLLLAGCAAGSTASGEPTPVTEVPLEVGEPAEVRLSTHCGLEWLEAEVDGRFWRTTELPADEAGNAVEPAWPQTGGPVDVVLHLLDEDTLEVTPAGSDVTHTYRSAPDPPGCE